MKTLGLIAIPLSEGAIDVLKARKGVHEQFVFTYAGKPIKEVKTAFQRACVEAGLGSYQSRGEGLRADGSPDRKAVDADDRVRRTAGPRYVGFTWHGLRHTWATWHRLRGTPLDVLQKLGGWSDPRMVQNYAHFNSDYLAGFVK